MMLIPLRRLLVGLAVVAVIAPSVSVDAQQTKPSEAIGETVETDTEPAMQRAFVELADADEGIREEAKARLMALPRRYLPSLQKLVERSRPLKPSQAVALRGIVKHIFLAGETYPANSNFGFLGIKMWPAIVKMPPAAPERPVEAGDDEAEPQPEPEEERPLDVRVGITITERLPGFVGSRLLLDGDIILGLSDRPELEIPNTTIFAEAIKETPAGKPVTFRLLRRGRVISVKIPLDPRPDAADPMNRAEMDALNERRQTKAEEFWQKTFGPLMDEAVG